MKRATLPVGTTVQYGLCRCVVKKDCGETVICHAGKGREETWELPFNSLRVISRPRTNLNRLSSSFRSAALYHLMLDGSSGGEYHSCIALRSASEALKLSYFKARRLYAEYFKPTDASLHGPWFFGGCYLDHQEHRAMCLLLMAEIVKDL